MTARFAATAYLGLGANLGDRLGALRAACQALSATPGVTVAARSRVFGSAAVTPDVQPPYLNAVVRLRTCLAPRDLLYLCLALERQLGRVRRAGRCNEARTLDVDLLLYDGRVIAEPGLTVPHPRLLDRAFVRVPLADVAESTLVHPQTHQALHHATSSIGLTLYSVIS